MKPGWYSRGVGTKRAHHVIYLNYCIFACEKNCFDLSRRGYYITVGCLEAEKWTKSAIRNF